eukprot:scaffold56554_cov64-Phaeocystis_antarctica.AAC.7
MSADLKIITGSGRHSVKAHYTPFARPVAHYTPLARTAAHLLWHLRASCCRYLDVTPASPGVPLLLPRIQRLLSEEFELRYDYDKRLTYDSAYLGQASCATRATARLTLTTAASSYSCRRTRQTRPNPNPDPITLQP